MPLVSIHLVRGRSPEQVRALLDAAHDAMVEALGVPATDRYQIVTQHEPGEVMALDTDLGLQRTDQLVIVHVISRQREAHAKQALYRLLAEHLERRCNVAAADLIVAVVENGEADWSFGNGRAQFLTGEL
jgi:phenylpyruvate tautomerase PptA (4-oxalocrotonate tautomerase family)